jgi:hypothetical protein
MRRQFKVEKLADYFGQYLLFLTCRGCSSTRRASPHTLANVCGMLASMCAVRHAACEPAARGWSRIQAIAGDCRRTLARDGDLRYTIA